MITCPNCQTKIDAKTPCRCPMCGMTVFKCPYCDGPSDECVTHLPENHCGGTGLLARRPAGRAAIPHKDAQ